MANLDSEDQARLNPLSNRAIFKHKRDPQKCLPIVLIPYLTGLSSNVKGDLDEEFDLS